MPLEDSADIPATSTPRTPSNVVSISSGDRARKALVESHLHLVKPVAQRIDARALARESRVIPHIIPWNIPH